MRFSYIAIAVLAASLTQSVSASIHTYDFTYDGTTIVTNQTSTGQTLAIGDYVHATYHALGNDYWTAPANAFIWTPILVLDGGTREGDLSWSFLNDAGLVDFGSLLGASSSSVHIPQPIHTSLAITFDQLDWTYVLTASTANTNTLGGDFFGYANLLPAVYNVVPDVSGVPEPASLALLGLGLAGLAATRRRKTV